MSNIQQRIKELEIKELELLRLQKRLRDENLIDFFKPNPIQQLLIDAWANQKFKVFTFTGANRIGKTTIDTIIAFSVMFGEFPWLKQKIVFPHTNPRKIRFVGQDWEKHIAQVVIPTFKKWWPKRRIVGPTREGPKKNNNGVEAYWRDEETGSTLEIMSNRQEPELHEGWEGDLVIYDEPPTRKVRIANARGLVDRQGRELFCMTLLKEAWIDREVIKARNEDGTPDMSIFSVNGDISCNVGYGLTQEGVDDFIKKLTDDEKDARIKGIPSYFSGLVYPQFQRQVHCVERFDIPTSWIVDIAIDVHPREKQAVLFMATSPQQERYLCYEIWEHGDGTAIADMIMRVIQKNVYRVGTIIIDPLSKGDSNNPNTTFDKIESVLLAHDYVLETATKDKTSGIIDVKKHLKGPNNKPSLFVFNDLVNTIEEFEGYLWEKVDKEDEHGIQKPIDKNDHFMENLYRLILLDTVYTDPLEQSYYDNSLYGETRNVQTGY